MSVACEQVTGRYEGRRLKSMLGHLDPRLILGRNKSKKNPTYIAFDYKDSLQDALNQLNMYATVCAMGMAASCPAPVNSKCHEDVRETNQICSLLCSLTSSDQAPLSQKICRYALQSPNGEDVGRVVHIAAVSLGLPR